MNTTSWQGVFPALWIPTDAAGNVMARELADQVRFLRQAGADGIMALGSTGEFVHLDVGPRQEVLRIVAEAAPGWPIIANCSDVSPRRVAALCETAREVGVAAISLLPPWFFAVSPADVVEFMVRSAEAAKLPLMVYNYPERCGHRLSLDTVAAVCDRVPVVGLKQSGGEFGYHRELAQLAAEKKFTLITGADTRIPEAWELGARGVVSGLSNALPEYVLAAYRATRAGDHARAAAETARLQQFAGTLKGLEFALDCGAAMQARGRPTGEFKQFVSDATRRRYAEVVSTGRAMLTGWGLVAAS